MCVCDVVACCVRGNMCVSSVLYLMYCVYCIMCMLLCGVRACTCIAYVLCFVFFLCLVCAPVCCVHCAYRVFECLNVSGMLARCCFAGVCVLVVVVCAGVCVV